MFRTWFTKLATARMSRAARRGKPHRLWLESLEPRDVPTVTVGPEFQVNTTTTNDQRVPSIAMDPAGNFVVAWVSTGQDGSGSGIYAQRYAADGTTEGNEFRVNTLTTGTQFAPSVAVDATGNFIVAWQSNGQDGSGYGVYAQRYTVEGILQGSEFRVNTVTTGNQSDPSLAVDAAGNFVVAWASAGQDGSGSGIYAQRYTADGTPQGSEFRVNSSTFLDQLTPSVAANADGNFVIAWNSDGDIRGRRFAANGTPQGNDFFVDFDSSDPAVALDEDGDFVIAWQRRFFYYDPYGYMESVTYQVLAQRYAASGTPQGDSFAVSTFSISFTGQPTVAVSAAGDFVVAWAGPTPEGGYGINARQYAASGTPQGNQFRVNTTDSDFQRTPSVAVDPDGNFTVAWGSYDQDGSRYGVYAQRFANAPNQAPTDLALSNAAIVENAGANAVVGTLSATDPDVGEQLTFALVPGTGSADNALFNVSGNQLRANASFDFETKNSYSVRLRVTDAAGLTSENALTITVTDQDENPPPVPVGSEFRVNTVTASGQFAPAIGVDAAGNVVVAWVSDGQDGSGYGVYAQRFAADGTPLGSEFRVNPETSGFQSSPAIAVEADGDFVIAWTGPGYGYYESLYARRYAANGSPQGGAFQVNTVEDHGHARNPTLAVDADGDFVVAWDGDFILTGDPVSDVRARRYAANGTPQGNEFNVIDNFGLGENPSVATGAGGDFIVAWADLRSDPSDHHNIVARRFAADGTPLGSGFQVNTVTADTQTAPAVAVDAAGNFVIAWVSYDQDGDGRGIYAQRYAPDGASLGVEFRVNFVTNGNQSSPTVAADAAGNFVVAWTSNGIGEDGSSSGVYAQRFAAGGTPKGAEFRVNTFTANSQGSPTIAAGSAGNFVVAWSSSGQDGSNSGVYAQRYGSLAPTNVGLSKNTIAENAGANAVVGTLSATDADVGDKFTFALVSGTGSADNALFNVSGNHLRTNTSFDFETRSSYSVRVRVTDAGGLTFEKPFTITVTNTNDASTLGNIATPIAYAENANLLLAPAGTATDTDSANFDTGKLTVAITANASGNDRLTIRSQGFAAGQIGISGSTVSFGSVPIGTFAGGVGTAPLVVTFNANATPARVQAVLRNVRYQLLFDNPTLLTRTVRYTLTDGDGGTSATVKQTVNIAPVNDTPTVAAIATSVSYMENATLLLAPSGTVADVDSANLATGKLTVAITANASANDRLSIRHQGFAAGQIGVSGTTVTFGSVPIGTFTGGVGTMPLVITFNASATPARVQAVLRNIRYQLLFDNPTILSRNVRYTLSDGDGGTSAAFNQTVNIVTINDAPTLGGITGPKTYNALAIPLILAPAGTVADVDSPNFDGGKLTVRLAANGGSSDRLTIRHQGFAAGQIGVSGTNITFGSVVIGTFTGGAAVASPLVVTFNASATVARVQAVLRNITYANVNATPATNPRTVRFTLTDGDGGTSAAVDEVVNISVS